MCFIIMSNNELHQHRKRLRALIPQRHLLCYLCGEVIPKSKGGATEPWNLFPAHKSCNELKAAVKLAEFREKQR